MFSLNMSDLDRDSDSDRSDDGTGAAASMDYWPGYDQKNWKGKTATNSFRNGLGANWKSAQRHAPSTHNDQSNCAVDFKILTQWANKNPRDLVDALLTQQDLIKTVLRKDELPVDWVHFLALSFQKVTQDKHRVSKVSHIMELVAHSNFVDRHIPKFLLTVHENPHILTVLYTCIRAFLDILDYIAIRFSDCSNKCFICVCRIEEIGTRFNILKEGNDVSNQCCQLKVKSCPIPLVENLDYSDCGHGWKRRVKAIPMPDEASPPDDFTEKSIFPDVDELEASTAPFLRANKTKGPYRDLRHYTDVHFRLLREDYLSPLREGLKTYKQMTADGQEVISNDLRFYQNVKLVSIKEYDGINFIVQFNPKVLGDIKWEFSKRFLFGSLLCFSKDNFQSVMFATVINRDVELLKQGILEVCFQSNLEQILTSSENDSFIIAETVSYFESYKHVLEGLQEVPELPLEEYILYCNPEPTPPKYLRERPSYDLKAIMADDEDNSVQILDPLDWPDHEDTVMNSAQLEAVKLALTSELAIIQGPPGTGKTYVGLHIVELLLKNRPVGTSTQSPILVVCYTNHALDQFLEGIWEFCNGGIIRVGGRSSSEKLKDFNLKELRKNPNMDRRLKRSINYDLRESKKRLRQVSYLIKKQWQESLILDTSIQNVNNLEEEMTTHQVYSLTDSSRGGGNGKEMNVWLKASNASMEVHLKKAAERRLIELIVTLNEDDERLPDEVLLHSNRTRIEFEHRVKVYKGWLAKYKADNEKRLGELLKHNQHKRNDGLIADLCRDLENAGKRILRDDAVLPYISCDEVYDKIKLCVKQEYQVQEETQFIKSWLLKCFFKVDKMFDDIEKLMKVKVKPTHTNVMPDRRVHDDRVVIDDDDRIVISDDSDADDDNDMAGFRDYDSHDDSDEVSSSGSQESKMVNEFRDLRINYKESEKRETVLLERAKMLHIQMSEEEEQEDDEEEEGWQNATKMTYSKVFKMIKQAKPLSEEEAKEIYDVWSLSLPKRYSLYKLWVLMKKTKIAREIIELTNTYNEFLKLKKRALSRKDIAILRKGQVIGMTTTGAARYRTVLQDVKPQIIIVEEAAEVLEAHIVTTLNKHCKHLILIGDHQQLRPNPTVHTLAKDYDLEISLFERLVKNSVKLVTLQVQHRMRPEISKYLLNIYPKLRNHPTVSCYGDIKGTGSNVYFLSHNYRESAVSDSKTKENVHEAKFLTKLCKYLLQQGYEAGQITVLSAYSGQVAIIRECMEPEEDLYKYVRVTSVDNYQGEENDILLLSLVRSNLEQDVGFLKTSNRVCVALSRAKQGMFVIGNLSQLENVSRLWEKILGKARANNELGVALKLVCMNHNQHETFIQHAEDFALKVPEGGCNQVCGAELFCGHVCSRMCHISDPSHSEMLCEEFCLHSCDQGHPCPKKCYEECGDCEILVEKDMPLCGHKDYIQCYVDVFDGVCKQPCKQQLPCGHLCMGLCGECSRTSEHRDCEELVEKTWNTCGDASTVPCHTDTKTSPCPAKCREKLRCGDVCKGTCGGCLTKRVHKPCQAKCKKALPCGHQCQSKCGMPCEPCGLRCSTMCRHTACSKTTCGEICDLCKENCAFVCKHRQCSEKCADECKQPPCKQLCNLMVACNHRCSSICGESCVCYKCDSEKYFKLIDFSKSRPGNTVFADAERAKKFNPDKDTIFMKVPRCGHVFTLHQLDQYVQEYDPKGFSYIRCPGCKNTIQGIGRYDHLNKMRSHIRENRKYQLEELNSVSDSVIEKVKYSLGVVDKFCPFDLDNYMRHRDKTIKKSHAHALNILSRNAYILFMIVEIHKEFNFGMPFNPDKWKNSMKSCQTGITLQYEEEMTMELHRLLILEQLVSIKRLLDESDLDLPESLKNQYKHTMRHDITHKLTLKLKENSELVLRDLYKILSASTATISTKNVAEKLVKKSSLAATLLDKPPDLDLCAILEAEDILPCSLEGDQSEEESEESVESSSSDE